MVSIKSMVLQLAAMLGTGDFTEWEEAFVQSVENKLIANKGLTTELSDKQVTCIERIWQKHFAY